MSISRDHLYRIHDLLGTEGREILERVAEYAGKHADSFELVGDEAAADKMNTDLGLLVDILRPWNASEDGRSALPDGTEHVAFDPRTPRPWLIQLSEDHTHYWLEGNGWVHRPDAQTYTDEEREAFDLPMGGEWCRADGQS